MWLQLLWLFTDEVIAVVIDIAFAIINTFDNGDNADNNECENNDKIKNAIKKKVQVFTLNKVMNTFFVMKINVISRTIYVIPMKIETIMLMTVLIVY